MSTIYKEVFAFLILVIWNENADYTFIEVFKYVKSYEMQYLNMLYIQMVLT